MVGIEHKVQNASVVAHGPTKKDDNQENLLIQRSNSKSPSSSISRLGTKHLTDQKPGPLSGTKRPNSHWRDTRSHQNRGGPDPHDDFLDTPLENIRGNLKKPTKEVLDLPDPGPQDMNLGSSDDETQDINVDPGPQNPQMAPPKTGAGGFKYVEPVRKKAERENLKGIECKQCKKFYDAVLPDGGGKDVNSRCEHHDGVSRHRYRYAPPLTPEGFWNIGFESEM